MPVSVISDKDRAWPLLDGRLGATPMILVDAALRRREAEGRPVRVAMVGAGFMGRGVANQIVNSVPGHGARGDLQPPPRAAPQRAYEEAGRRADRDASTPWRRSRTPIARGVPAVTDDADLVCEAEGIDALLEVTGSIEFGAGVVLERDRATASTSWS